METVRTLISEEEVSKRIDQLAEQISLDYEGKVLHLICILKGSVFFTTELAKRLTIPVTMDFMSCSSYGSGKVSKGIVRLMKDLDEPIEGREVLLIEDIIDSGNTLSYLMGVLRARKPASLSLCTLLDKPSRRVHFEVEVDYCGFQIEDLFVVGCGMDFDQRYRNLPYVGVLEETDGEASES